MRVLDVIVVSEMTWPRAEPSVAAFLTLIAVAQRETALRECRGLDDRIAEVRSVDGKEKQMSRRVEKNVKLARRRADLETTRASLRVLGI